MALGTGEHTIGGEKVNVVQKRRVALGTGGLEQQGLSVDLKRGGVGSISVPTKPAHPLNLLSTTVIRRPKLPSRRQPKVQRVTTRRPASDPIALRPRQIVP